MPAKDTLARVHELLAQQMLDRLESGEPLTPQEMQAVIKFLANNGITATPNADNGEDALIRIMEAAQRSIQDQALN